MTEEELRDLAERIRGELPAMIADDSERAEVADRLTRALSQPRGSARPALTEALRSHEAIRDRLELDQDRAITLAGDSQGVIGVLFACPRRDYSVVRDRPTDEVLLCPNDGSVLDRITG
ncbi:hypothetical protein ODJ79_39965 [Actinoplanes sp. KI2]|uniref:hypothetical protein n=1 Tax=Actinoplanes sp. KI2 TaxID=2983315 RepID=UPI0021D5812E|nr:hypothetical protein [Actinoplanes sp. KI2]MCU7729930.1 hypothetical protein [Actinoplanes sp. KI2]